MSRRIGKLEIKHKMHRKRFASMTRNKTHSWWHALDITSQITKKLHTCKI